MRTVPIDIRPMAMQDAAALADLHAAAWRYTYRGIIPGAALEAMIARRGKHWWEQSRRATDQTLLLEFDSMVVGYANFGPCRHAQLRGAGEIYELYLRPEAHGAGLGRRLFDAAREQLRLRGHSGLVIWCLRENELGVQFYRALGGRQAGERTEQIGGAALEAVAFYWR